MNKNDLLKTAKTIYRVLGFGEGETVMLIDCQKETMPALFEIQKMTGAELITEEQL